VRFIGKFLDKVCGDAGLPADRLRQLHLMVPGESPRAASLHAPRQLHLARRRRRHADRDAGERAPREQEAAAHPQGERAQQLAPAERASFQPRMLVPTFLPGEQMLLGYLRVFLLPDGRCHAPPYHEKLHVNNYLPAEGAVFLTNYRLIFIGQACDPYSEPCKRRVAPRSHPLRTVCDKVVMRAIPVMAMTKQKRVNQPFLNAAEQGGHYLRDVLQIRSATFQVQPQCLLLASGTCSPRAPADENRLRRGGVVGEGAELLPVARAAAVARGRLGHLCAVGGQRQRGHAHCPPARGCQEGRHHQGHGQGRLEEDGQARWPASPQAGQGRRCRRRHAAARCPAQAQLARLRRRARCVAPLPYLCM